VNDEYTARHQSLVQDLKDRGYSSDAINEFETRMGTIRSQFVAKAIDFQDKSGFTKVVSDTDQLAISLSQYASNNPNAVQSALDELKVAVTNSGLDAIEQERVYNDKKDLIIRGAQQGFALQHPDAILQLYGFPNETKVEQNSATGELVNLGQAQKTVADTLTSAGFNSNVIAGFLGNFHVEGGYTGKSGDNGTAAGIAQWRKERRDAFKAMFGVDPAQASFEDQAKFVVHEMQNPEKAGMTVAQRNQILAAKSPEEAAKLIDKYYERSNGKTRNERAEASKLFIQTMAHADQTIQGLITPGNIDVSKLPAIKNADGSVSTVRSISIEEDGKTYLIPTVIDGKVVSDDEATASFNKTGKHLGVFSDTKSADAYAQQLHESEAQRVGADASGKTGIPILDMSTGPERVQMLTLARTIMNERDADAKAAARAAHEEWLNQLYNGLQDGKLGQSDLNDAYSKGLITDYDERMKAQKIIDDKNKEDTALQTFGVMIRNDIRGNPYDPKAQAAVDKGFDFTVKREAKLGSNVSPFLIGLSIWQKTGVMPKQAGVMIRGALIGTDPQAVAAAASVASNMLDENPNAFAGVEGGTDIGKAAATYAHYVDDLGMTAEEAAQKIALMNSPEFQAKLKADAPSRDKFINTITGDKTHSGIDIEGALNKAIIGNYTLTDKLTFGYFRDGGKFTAPQRAEAQQTFLELALDSYDKNHDEGAAIAYASRQMARFYGVENGRLLKFPASKAYPEIMGSREYIFDQAKSYVDKFVGFDVPKENIWLQPTANGSTAAAFKAGKPPPYEIHYITETNGQRIYHFIPGKVFIADVEEARRQAAVKARQTEKNIREARDAAAAAGF
jgi:hypothetical protein